MNSPHKKLKQLSVLIVGCGNIAGGFDNSLKLKDFPRTHAGAYIRDNRFKMTACVDPDENQRQEFMNKWNIKFGFSSIDEIFYLNHKFDVISICSPTIEHSYNIEKALILKPKLIFCEKPITASLADAERLVELCKNSNVLMAVNHTRRWDPSVCKLQADIFSGRRGILRSIIGIYNKGILNNGSHMLDLLHFLVGPVHVLKVGKPFNDYLFNDPTIPVLMENNQGISIHLACANAEDYAEFELQLIFSLGILSIEEGGLYWRERPIEESASFKNYRVLGSGKRYMGECSESMLKAINNIYLAITSNEALVSSGETAILAQRMCEKIKLMAVAK